MHAKLRVAVTTSYRSTTGVIAGAALCLLAGEIVLAGPLEDSIQDPRVEEIITTGVRERPLYMLPRSANIITADDIALLPSANIVDLLAREANLNLRAVQGNAKFSGIDIRGQGDTYTSNVLILVDGIRLNPADLAGADFSSLPLAQIDRVEVIRGANSVRYGSGAVGGVINIITKRASEGGQVNARARTGSYATVGVGAGGGWQGEKLSVAGDLNYSDSDGYRDNSALQTNDAALRFGVQPWQWLSADLRGAWHTDEYGLPGPVSQGDDPTSSNFPFDHGMTDDDRARFTVALGNDSSGVLTALASSRDRNNRYVIGQTGPVPEPDQIQQDDQRLEVLYDKSMDWWGQTQSFTLGLELSDVDYARTQYASDGSFADEKRGDTHEKAWFVAADIGLHEKLSLSLGYRADNFQIEDGTFVLDCADEDKTDFGGLIPTPICVGDAPVFIQPDANGLSNRTWHNNAYEAGLVFSHSDRSSWFVSYAQSFRNPNVDELIVAEADLRPQTGDHFDVGTRQLFSNDIEWNFSLFYNRNEDEILYGIDLSDNTTINRNSDEPTRRIGGETDIRWYVMSSLTLTANVGYTHAKFTETNTYVPLVPKWTGGAGVQWLPLNNLLWSVATNFVGERYDGNDFQNQMPQLSSYSVTDTRLSYELGATQFYAGINNLFDKLYTATAYSGQIYPMPDRNYYVGLNYRMSGLD